MKHESVRTNRVPQPARRFAPAIATFVTIAVVVGVSLVPCRAEIQNDQIGFSTNHVFDSQMDGEHIDALTGNLTLTVPLGPKFMLNDHFGYQVTLYYNAKIWEHDCTQVPAGQVCQGTLRASDRFGTGWAMHFGRIYHHTRDKSYVYRYQTSSGAEHFFCDVAQYNRDMSDPFCNGGYTEDGTGIMVQHDSSSSEWVVYPGDGTKVHIGYAVGGGLDTTGWYATRIEDYSGGQYLDIHYAGSGSFLVDYLQDSQGRRIEFTDTYDGIQIDIPSFAGSASITPATIGSYKLGIATANLYDPVAASVPPMLKRFLYSVSFPGQGELYQFTYHSYGYLTSRHLPTGADIDYNYSWYQTSFKRPYHGEMWSKILYPDGRGGKEYRWTYNRFGDGVIRDPLATPTAGQQFTGTNAGEVHVLDPFDNLTVYYFDRTLFDANGCDSCGNCPNNWSDGSLRYVFYYAGDGGTTTRLVRRVK